jgi:hypothetical protein
MPLMDPDRLAAWLGSMAHLRSCPIARSAALVRPVRDDDRLTVCGICAAPGQP